MIKIGVLNSKGGVGKTLISTSLATRASKDMSRVALLDLDPQLGSERWQQHRKKANLNVENPSVLIGESNIADAMEKLEMTGWDVVFCDGLPGGMERTIEAIKAIDFVVIPLKASDQDLASTEYTVGACMEHGRPFLLVINECETRKGGDKRAIEVHETLSHLVDPECVARQMIGRRVGFVDAVNMGKSVHEMGAAQKAAQDEIDALYDEVMTKAKAASQHRSEAA